MADPIAWTFTCGGDYVEELSWLTDQMRATTGGTQHRCLRPSPRTLVEYSALESGANRRWMDVLLRKYSGQAWWAPISIDTRILGAAAALAADTLVVAVDGTRFAVGSHVLVMTENPRQFEVHEIEAVASGMLTLTTGLAGAWPAGSLVIPVRRARLAEMPSIGRFTADDSALVDLQFRLEEELNTAPAVPGAGYRGFPVFDFVAPVWTSDPTWVPARALDVMDDDIGVPQVTDVAGVAAGITTMQYGLDTSAAIATFQGALFALAGRWSPAWVPSWTHDLRLVANVAAAATTIDVEGPLLSALGLEDNHRDLRIELYDGTVLYRRLTNAVVQTSAVDRLTVDSPLPAFAMASVKMVCFLTLCTQGSDTNRLQYFDPQTMQCELTWEELDHEL